ncbi:MAG: copper homeostasis protein CutC [Solobacterium sp.]|nr:copper homeostasis protein CutC [Solobacterium sp.]
MIAGITVEICAGSLSDCIRAASVQGTDRIELNCALELGGLTPSYDTFLSARKATDKKIICMVRPRGAGFVYSETEKDSMYRDAENFLKNGADGIVFGCLDPDRTIDIPFTQKMVQLISSYKKEAVFHKAFDETPDPFDACEKLIECGISRILTSGQKDNVEDGIPLLRQLQSRFGSRIEILPGGGVNEKNAASVLKKTRCRSIHMSAKSSVEDSPGSYFAVDPAKIRKILSALENAANRRDLTRDDTAMIRNDTFEESRYTWPEDDRDH